MHMQLTSLLDRLCSSGSGYNLQAHERSHGVKAAPSACQSSLRVHPLLSREFDPRVLYLWALTITHIRDALLLLRVPRKWSTHQCHHLVDTVIATRGILSPLSSGSGACAYEKERQEHQLFLRKTIRRKHGI